MTTGDIFDDLEAEQDRLDSILRSLDDSHWAADSKCPGWSIADVILHLAQTEEGVLATIEGREAPIPVTGAATIDEAMAQWVEAQRGASGADVHARWDAARRDAVKAMRMADPNKPVAWAATPLKPKTLATTRLSEHWIHTLDVADPLGIEVEDTDNLHHIAWLAFRTLSFAFTRAGRDAPPSVRLELTSPSGEPWEFGSEDAEVAVRGPAGEFCRIAARRLDPADASQVTATGERGAEVLELVRTYA
jgi:uncharacterized protein (TIGR03084 family)